MPLLPQLNVPQSPAKAAAFDRWLAQGGKPGRKSGKFLSGPQKGMTYDQAMQKFEGMWAGAPDALKEKYAKRAGGGNDLAPSEKPPVAPPKPAGQMYADQKKNRMGYYSRINGVAPAVPAEKKTVNPAATSGAGRGKAIGTPAEQANVAQMVSEGGDFATADMGMGGWSAGVAMRARDSIARAENPTTVPREMAKANEEAAKVAAQKQADQKREADFKAAQQAEAARLGVSMPTPISPTPTPAVAQAPAPAAPAPAIPAVTPPMEAPTGRPVIGSTPPKVNRLTGLPMGYMPGDSTNGMDGAMKARADASTSRMQSVAPPPRAIPVVAPAPPKSVEQRAADEMRRQAAINANPGRVNPDDPRKFFTGRVKPLDQLVAAYRPR
jgi:hypothetical protein